MLRVILVQPALYSLSQVLCPVSDSRSVAEMGRGPISLVFQALCSFWHGEADELILPSSI